MSRGPDGARGQKTSPAARQASCPPGKPKKHAKKHSKNTVFYTIFEQSKVIKRSPGKTSLRADFRPKCNKKHDARHSPTVSSQKRVIKQVHFYRNFTKKTRQYASRRSAPREPRGRRAGRVERDAVEQRGPGGGILVKKGAREARPPPCLGEKYYSQLFLLFPSWKYF